MIDPAGRFFDNASGTHRYSRPILVIGVDAAMKEVRIDPAKFKERGGIYEW
jgi:radical S-adenosyl methionine domain-containing protein 2